MLIQKCIANSGSICKEKIYLYCYVLYERSTNINAINSKLTYIRITDDHPNIVITLKQ